MHSLTEASRIEYVVGSFIRHHDVAVRDSQRHGVDVVNVVSGPHLVPVSVPRSLQFDRDFGTRHRANERASRLLIRNYIYERKPPLCQSARQDILEFDFQLAH